MGIWECIVLLLYVYAILTKLMIRFFLTIGFGDFTPATDAGRPIFIVYALLAVPTMTVVGKSR